MRMTFLILVAILAACDAATPADNCTITFVDVPTTLPAGGLLTLEVSADSPAVQWQSYNALILEQQDRQLRVRLPYAEATSEITASSGCAKNKATAVIQLSQPRWEQVSDWTSDDGPVGREYGAMWLQPEQPEQVMLYGGHGYADGALGDLYALDMQTWQWSKREDPAPSLRLFGHRVLPLDNTSALIWGGLAEDEEGYYLPAAPGNLLNPETSSWVGLVRGVPDSRRYQAAVFVDETTASLYVVCGSRLDLQGKIRDCPVYVTVDNFNSTYALPVADMPEGRDGFAWAWVARQRRLIVFSGDTRATGSIPDLPEDELLAFDVQTASWSSLDVVGEAAPGRRNPGYFFDAANERLFVYGGTSNGQTSEPDLWALHLDVGAESWHRIAVADVQPTLRSSSDFLYLPEHKAALFGFGNSATEVFTDLWLLHLD